MWIRGEGKSALAEFENAKRAHLGWNLKRHFTSGRMANSEIGDDIREFCHWISSILKDNKIRSWKLRDFAVRFLDRYLHTDPSHTVWARDSVDMDCLPANLGGTSGHSSPLSCCRRQCTFVLHRSYRRTGRSRSLRHDQEIPHYRSAEVRYSSQSSGSLDLTLHSSTYEHMLTRMLSLGNVMVASSAVRRGPYWQICLHSQTYHCHIEAILKGVAEMLGLPSFQCYLKPMRCKLLAQPGKRNLMLSDFPLACWIPQRLRISRVPWLHADECDGGWNKRVRYRPWPKSLLQPLCPSGCVYAASTVPVCIGHVMCGKISLANYGVCTI